MSQNFIPHTFIPGTKAKAGEVNSNFEYLLNKVVETKTNVDTQITNLTDYVNIQNQGSLKIPFTINDGIELSYSNGVISFTDGKITTGNSIICNLENIADLPVSPKYYSSFIPNLTSNSVDGYVISCDSVLSTNEPYKMFNDNESIFWQASKSGDKTINVELPQSKVCKYISIKVRNDYNYKKQSPTYFNVIGSLDGLTWVNLAKHSNLIFNKNGEVKFFKLTNSNAYKYYKINTDAIYILKMDFYEESASGIYIPDDIINIFVDSQNNSYGYRNLVSRQYSEPDCKDENDIWLCTKYPYSAKKYSKETSWVETDLVYVGNIEFDSEGAFSKLNTIGYNQNGFILTTNPSSEFYGNFITKDIAKDEIYPLIDSYLKEKHSPVKISTVVIFDGSVTLLPKIISLPFLPNDGRTYALTLYAHTGTYGEGNIRIGIESSIYTTTGVVGITSGISTGEITIYTNDRMLVIYCLELGINTSQLILRATNYRRIV